MRAGEMEFEFIRIFVAGGVPMLFHRLSRSASARNGMHRELSWCDAATINSKCLNSNNT